MSDLIQKAFDFAADTTKQLITVASGVLTAAVLFSKDLDSFARHWALAAWGTLALSVLFGLAVLMNLTGQLQNSAKHGAEPSISASGVRVFSILQAGAFLLGMVLLVCFGFVAASSSHIQR